jgi:uncharacterized membrane protein YbaN (DUF454 family)
VSSFAWRVVAVIFLGLGAVGLLLPVVPQIPFLLLGAAAAAKGWPWLDQRLVAHPQVGPLIVGWRERRAIPRRAKVLCVLGNGVATVAFFLLPVPSWAKAPWARAAWLAVATVVAAWVWRRPDR